MRPRQISFVLVFDLGLLYLRIFFKLAVVLPLIRCGTWARATFFEAWSISSHVLYLWSVSILFQCPHYLRQNLLLPLIMNLEQAMRKTRSLAILEHATMKLVRQGFQMKRYFKVKACSPF
jgi:hypothetical protein